MNKLSDQYFNRILKEALEAEFHEEIGQTPSQAFKPSSDFENKMARLFSNQEEKKPWLNLVLKRAAVFFLVFVSIFGVFMATNSQAKDKLYSWIVEDFGNYSIFITEKPSLIEENLSFKDLKTTYMPADYKLVKSLEGRKGITYVYQNKKFADKLILIDFVDIGEETLKSYLNTEGASLEEVYIKGRNGFYWELDIEKYLHWQQNGVECLIVGNIAREEIIKIAENISK
ncbi:MAG: DUF4367 domain-containing protein [Bacillota bacterium]|nr:DUF4367 domain-containing protein [Bacillota bacterium]